MKLSVPDFMAKCPPKLLREYPNFIRQMELRIKEREAGTKADCIPRAPVLCITGSRYGGKSQFAVRASIGAITDGYAQSMMFATITEDGSKDSMNLIDAVLKEAEEPIIKRRDSDHPIRILSQGEPIYIEYLNKVDSKARQTKANILIMDEIEKWNEIHGKASLLTMFRHFDAIIVLSNQLPRWAKVLFEAENAVFVRIDYWENPALEPSRRESLDKLRVLDPEGWARDVMYLPTGGENRVFSERCIANIFRPRNPGFIPQTTIISIDPGAGGPDETAIFALDYDGTGIEARLLMLESVSDNILVPRVKKYRIDEMADEEIWDYSGIGKAIMSFREEPENWDKMGIVPFYGAAINKEKYYNARTEAIMLTVDMLNRGLLTVRGLSQEQIEELELEARATIFSDLPNARTEAQAVKVAKKEDIKKSLGGRSPNMLDAICMGVWRILTYTKTIVKIRNGDMPMTPTISGAPSIDDE